MKTIILAIILLFPFFISAQENFDFTPNKLFSSEDHLILGTDNEYPMLLRDESYSKPGGGFCYFLGTFPELKAPYSFIFGGLSNKFGMAFAFRFSRLIPTAYFWDEQDDEISIAEVGTFRKIDEATTSFIMAMNFSWRITGDIHKSSIHAFAGFDIILRNNKIKGENVNNQEIEWFKDSFEKKVLPLGMEYGLYFDIGHLMVMGSIGHDFKFNALLINAGIGFTMKNYSGITIKD